MILLLAAQVLLTATFLVSGLAKLPDRRATADAMISLRLPAPGLHRTVATALPIAEIVLALAVWLPVPVLPVVLAALATLLVAAYWGIIARALTFDERATCSCFGTLGSPEVSRLTLGRNTLLLVLAALALAGAILDAPGTSLTHSPVPLAQVATAVLAASLLTLLTIGGAKPGAEPPGEHTARDRARPAHAPTGADEDGEIEKVADLDYERAPTPFGVLQREDEQPTTLAQLTAQRAALLIWVRPGCGPCERVLNEVPAWREALEDVLSVRTLFRREPAALAVGVRERAGTSAALDVENNLATSLRVNSSPGAVLLGADGMLAGGPVGGAEEVIDFVEQIVTQIGEARESGDLDPGKRSPR